MFTGSERPEIYAGRPCASDILRLLSRLTGASGTGGAVERRPVPRRRDVVSGACGFASYRAPSRALNEAHLRALTDPLAPQVLLAAGGPVTVVYDKLVIPA